jgi:hypothetical protein
VDKRVAEVDIDTVEAVHTYNAGRYLEAHELFELIWMRQGGAQKIFYQGLVHIAMGFHYLVAGDFDRALAKLQRGAELLEDFSVDFLGVDVGTLRESVAVCRHRLAQLGPSGIMSFDRILIPRLTLLPHATREAR